MNSPKTLHELRRSGRVAVPAPLLAHISHYLVLLIHYPWSISQEHVYQVICHTFSETTEPKVWKIPKE